MKKIIITLLLAVMPFVTFAQEVPFSQFQDVEGVDYVSVNKEMFAMIGKMDASIDGGNTEKYLGMLDKLDNLKVFTTDEKKKMKELTSAVQDYLKKNPLEELMSIKDEGSRINIYVKQEADSSIVKEGLVFIEDADDKNVVLVSFTGNLDLNELNELKDLKGTKGYK